MPTKYQGVAPRKALEDNVKHVDRMLSDPITARAIKQKSKMLDNAKRDRERLERITPPDVTNDSERSAIAHRQQALEEAMIKGSARLGIDPMPTRRAMWETPAGAIGQQTRWSERWKNYTLGKDNKTLVKSDQGYGAMFEWKDNQRRLFKNREVDDPDIANIELFRPDHQEGSLDYKSRSFSLGSNITDSEFDELFPDREPTEVEKKLKEYKAQIDALTAQLQVINEDPETLPREVRRPGNAQPRCAYTAVSTGRQCKHLALPGSNYCGLPAHNKDK